MKKELVLIVFILSQTAFAGFFDECPTEPTTVDDTNISNIQGMQLPNCARSNLESETSVGNLTTVCGSCKNLFESRLQAYSLQNKKTKISIEETIKNEFKKNMAAALLEVSTIRQTGEIDADFTNVLKACDVEKNLNESKCNNGMAGQIRKSLSNELALLLSDNFSSSREGVLDRGEGKDYCPIPDKDILAAKANFVEKEISNPNVLRLLASMDPNTTDIEKSLSNALGNEFMNLKALILTHPLFSKLAKKTPKEFIGFFKSIPPGSDYKKVKSLLSNLPAAKTSFLSSIEETCSKNIRNLADNICKNPIGETAKISDLNAVMPLFNYRIEFSGSETTSTDPASYDKTAELLRICSIRSLDPKSKDISGIFKEMNSNLPSEYASLPLERASIQMYEDQLNASRARFCEYKNQPSECDKTQSQCRLFMEYKALTTVGTVENSLASSGDSKINSLLRNMIGNPSAQSLDPLTREVLVEKGIIPATEGGEVKALAQIDRDPSSPTFGKASTATSGGTKVAAAKQDRPQATRVAAASGRPVAASSSSELQIDPTTLAAGANRDLVDGIGDQMRSDMLRSAITDEVGSASQRRPAQGSAVRAPVTRPQATAPLPTGAAPIAGATVAQTDNTNTGGALTPLPRSNGVELPGGPTNTRAQLSRAQMNAALEAMTTKNSVGGAAALSAGGATAGNATIGKSSDGSISVNVNPNDVYNGLVEQLKMGSSVATEILDQIAKARNFNFKFNGSQVNVEFRDGKYYVGADSSFNANHKREIERFLNDIRVKASRLSGLNNALDNSR